MSIISKIFSGGAGELIGKVADTVDRFVTTKEEKEALKIELQRVVNDHEARMAELANKAEEQAATDRASARTREADFIKATGHQDWVQTFLVVACIVIFGTATYLILTNQLPPVNEHAALNLLGIIEGVFLSIVSYYFGSSLGSRFKDMKK